MLESAVSMTVYQVFSGQNGKQFYLKPGTGRAMPLSGAGVTTPTVGIYSGAEGSRWYVDRTGAQVDLQPGPEKPPFEGAPPALSLKPDASPGGLPLGVPIYWGGSGAYYVGAAGQRAYLSESQEASQHFHDWHANWHESNNWYHRRNWWPGKDRGLPPASHGQMEQRSSPEPREKESR